MDKTLKSLTENQVANKVKQSARQLYLAGMGAYAKAEATGGKVVNSLVVKGGISDFGIRKAVEGRTSAAKAKVATLLTRLEKELEERVASTLLPFRLARTGKFPDLPRRPSGFVITPETLRRETRLFRRTAGVSHNNRDQGFQSAFRDNETGEVYLSRCADGSPATVHLLDGLPDELVLRRDAEGRVTSVKPAVEAGFLLDGRFYTREQAAERLTKTRPREN